MAIHLSEKFTAPHPADQNTQSTDLAILSPAQGFQIHIE